MNKNSRKKRLAEWKQMAFDTAIRNPERYRHILQELAPFEGQVLNDEVLLNIVSTLYLKGLVRSRDVIIDEKEEIDDVLKQQVKNVNATRNGDGGFPKGYAARFWTYMRTLSELGFVYAQYQQTFQFSNIAKKMINDEISEQAAFAVQAMKYNRRSPYRNVLNDFNYFRFILAVLKRKSRLSYPQFIVSLYSQNGDADEFCQLLEKQIFTLDNVAEFICGQYGETNEEQTFIKDYPDVVLRVLILTGFVSVVHTGATMIELNTDHDDIIEKWLDIPLTLTEEEKTDGKLFFERLASWDSQLLPLIQATSVAVSEFNHKAVHLLQQHNLTEQILITELKKLGEGKQKSNLPFMSYVAAPLQLEFLLSLLLVLKYQEGFKVQPNFIADHYGMPISHAPARMGDIELISATQYWLIEVTLIRNKKQQLNAETTSVIRHLNEALSDYNEHFLSFVAPIVHQDTEEFYQTQIVMMQLSKLQKTFLKPYSLAEFIEVTERNNNLSDMRQYTQLMLDKVKRIFSV